MHSARDGSIPFADRSVWYSDAFEKSTCASDSASEDRLIQGQRRTFDDPDTFELEDTALQRDAQCPGLGLDSRTDPRLAHHR